jgi:hypothetical protein
MQNKYLILVGIGVLFDSKFSIKNSEIDYKNKKNLK